MRNIVIGICSFTFLLYLILIGFTVWGRQRRESELESSLNFAMEQAMDNLQYIDRYRPNTNEEFVAVFEQQLVSLLMTDAEYVIDILDVDVEKGLLSVRVTEFYKHLNGRQGKVQVQKSIILDQGADREIYGKREIKYFLGDQLYRSYMVDAGEEIFVPRTPEIEDGEFLGWRNQKNGMIYSSNALREIKVSTDMELVAEISRATEERNE